MIKKLLTGMKEKAEDLMNLIAAKLEVAKMNIKSSQLADVRKGAFAFEYIIVLVVMVVIIFSAWNMLGNAVLCKAQAISSTVEGFSGGTGSSTGNPTIGACN